jgi:hypothetical protein
VDTLGPLDFINSRPSPSNAIRVLFIGDSLTIHGRAPKVWDNFCGMAAFAPERDFVHLATAHIQSSMDRPVEAFYNKGGDGKLPSILRYLESRPHLKPDLTILQGGENDPLDASFRATYRALLERTPLIVLGDWWRRQIGI